MLGNPDSGIREIFCQWNPESRALESGIQLKESGIQVALTKDPESTAWNPESKTVLDFLSYGENYVTS